VTRPTTAPGPVLARVLDRLAEEDLELHDDGDGWRARCPAHRGESATSLSLAAGDDGRALLTCHSGCATEAIVSALGLRMCDLFPNDGTTKTKTRSRIVATYDYRNEDEELVLQVVRMDPKAFRQRRPARDDDDPATVKTDRDGRRWVWSARGVRPVLYRLADVRHAVEEERPLLVTEGEKDCDRARAAGLVATTNAGGAGKWRPEHTEALRGAHVRIVADRDAPGERHALDVFAALEPVAASVQIVRAAEGKDLADHLEAGLAVEDLVPVDPEDLRRKIEEDRGRLLALPRQDAGEMTLEDLLRDSGLEALEEDADLAAVEEALRNLADLLVDADQLRRASARAAAVQLLQRRKVAGAAKLADAALGAAAREEKEGKLQGKPLLLSRPGPAADPVDGAGLLQEIHDVLVRYVVMPAASAVLISMWTVMTYVLDSIEVAPILGIVSPEKRCGKTTLLGVLQALVAKPLPASSITAAALFRAVEAATPTLLVDEADTFLRDNDELRGVLNAGHSRTTAYVIRTAGDDHEPRMFSVWCAKAIALILLPRALPSTIEDRSVLVRLRRRAPGERVERLRIDRLHELEDVRSRIARWAEDHGDDLRHADPDVPDVLHDRAQDNVRALLAIADAAGGDWPTRAREAAVTLHGSGAADSETPGVLLLADLREMFVSRNADRLTSSEIVEALGEMEDRPWMEWGRSRKPHHESRAGPAPPALLHHPRDDPGPRQLDREGLLPPRIRGRLLPLPPLSRPSQRHTPRAGRPRGESRPSHRIGCDAHEIGASFRAGRVVSL
jgi:hypothetical protein